MTRSIGYWQSWYWLKRATMRLLSETVILRKVCISFFAVMACFSTPVAFATLITLDPTATGSISQQQTCGQPGCFPLQYSSTNPLGELRFWFSYMIGVSTGSSSVGYLVFDLSGLGQNVESAALELDLRYATNADPNLRIRTLDAATVADLVTNPVGTQNGAIDLSSYPIVIPPLYSQLAVQYYAIGSGTEAGLLTQTGPFDGLYNAELSSSAVSLINTTSGLFGLGLAWTPNTANQFPNGGDALSFNAPPRLMLRDANVPLPGTAWLILAAMLALLISHSRKDQKT